MTNENILYTLNLTNKCNLRQPYKGFETVITELKGNFK